MPATTRTTKKSTSATKATKTAKPKTANAKAAAKKAAPAPPRETPAPAPRAKTAAGAFSQRRNQAAEKLRNLAEGELAARQREMADQLFRLRFQLKMGQTESIKKLRELRKDIA